MGVAKRTGMGSYRSGRTWHPGVWVHSLVQIRVPCFELAWDDEGHPTPTGRYALLDEGEYKSSDLEGAADFEPGEWEIDHATYVEEMTSLARTVVVPA